MKTYCLVGTGYRGTWMWLKNLTENYADCAKLVGLCDPNEKRANYANSQLPYQAKVYTDFDKMLAEQKPDEVIVTTMDSVHDEYVVRALEAGCNVICEKPLTNQPEKLTRIIEAEERTGKHVRVTFNLRFQPQLAKIKEVMMTGVVGEVLHVNLEWMLDTSHGADYFRRWHRYLKNSNSLLCHKSTHHFDIVNWLIDQDPISVFGNGSLRYYGQDLRPHGERCSTCPYADTCELKFPNQFDKDINGIYFGVEDVDHYYRDRCLFDKDIDIYDTMSLNVKYSKGALMTYSLIAYSPYEGYKLTITGTKGRLETDIWDNSPLANNPCNEIRVFTRDGDLLTYSVPKSSGTHGGGDQRMMNLLIRGADNGHDEDPLHQMATTREGAMSLMIGVCAVQSIESGKQVNLQDLVDIKKHFGNTKSYN